MRDLNRLYAVNPIDRILKGVSEKLEPAEVIWLDRQKNVAVVVINVLFGIQLLNAIMDNFIRYGISWDLIKMGSKGCSCLDGGMVIMVTSNTDMNQNGMQIIPGLKQLDVEQLINDLDYEG